MFIVLVKWEPGVRELRELKSVGLVDKGLSFIALDKGIKSSLLAMVSLKYVAMWNGSPFRVSLRTKTTKQEYDAHGSPRPFQLAQNQFFILSIWFSHLYEVDSRRGWKKEGKGKGKRIPCKISWVKEWCSWKVWSPVLGLSLSPQVWLNKEIHFLTEVITFRYTEGKISFVKLCILHIMHTDFVKLTEL